MPYAIVDVGKTAGEPDLNLPADADLIPHGTLCWLDPTDESSTLSAQPFFHILIDEAARWVGFISATEEDLQWLETLGLGAALYRVDADYVRDNRPALEALGLQFDGDGNMLAPHHIAGEPNALAPST